MYQFFVEDAQIRDGIVTVKDGDARHIHSVLRLKDGEEIRISEASGKSYFCRITEQTKETVCAAILTEAEGTELPCRITLFQGLPKSDKMELIIQKAVELGVSEIVPVAMTNCVVRLDGKKAAAKTARWQEIAKSAAKQSKRSAIPAVRVPATVKEAAEQAKECDVMLVPYENEEGMQSLRRAVKQIGPGSAVGIWIGPEGGFTEAEIGLAKEQGMIPVSLGRRILRTETAGIAMLSILMYETER